VRASISELGFSQNTKPRRRSHPANPSELDNSMAIQLTRERPPSRVSFARRLGERSTGPHITNNTIALVQSIGTSTFFSIRIRTAGFEPPVPREKTLQIPARGNIEGWQGQLE